MTIRGSIAALFAVFSWYASPFGFDVEQIGIIIMSSTLCGILGCVLAGIFLRRTKKYKLTCIVSSIAVLISLLLLHLAMETSKSVMPSIMAAIAGLFMFPYITTTT
jgi:MFS-type transporter involved in bile tolerance (Atg22 family)